MLNGLHIKVNLILRRLVGQRDQIWYVYGMYGMYWNVWYGINEEEVTDYPQEWQIIKHPL